MCDDWGANLVLPQIEEECRPLGRPVTLRIRFLSDAFGANLSFCPRQSNRSGRSVCGESRCRRTTLSSESLAAALLAISWCRTNGDSCREFSDTESCFSACARITALIQVRERT